MRRALADAGVKRLPGPFLDFLDPWGNRIEIVGYDNIQFTKAPHVLRGMGLAHLEKNAARHQGAGRKGHGAGVSRHWMGAFSGAMCVKATMSSAAREAEQAASKERADVFLDEQCDREGEGEAVPHSVQARLGARIARRRRSRKRGAASW